MTVKKTGKKTNAEKRGFESSLDRLESIVDAMEDGSLSLEKMMAHFEEGQKLIGFCSKKLNEIERKIDILAKKGDQVIVKKFDADEEEDDANGEADEPELF